MAKSVKMAPSDGVPDSTDWLSTPLSGFAAVEAALRCQVCKDLYKTPMMTSCSHTFCSLCIRRALSNDGKCPLCRSAEQELKLRSNWSMEETVEAFSRARETALSLARKATTATTRSPKRPAQDVEENDDFVMEDSASAPTPKRLRISARIKGRGGGAPARIVEEEQAADEDEDVVRVSDDDDYVPEPPSNDGLVPCPMCQKRMKEWQVFNHLESCPGPAAKANKMSATTATTTSSELLGQIHEERRRRQQQAKLERLPSLNYSMLKDAALRKKMADLGISSQGPRPIVERRHREWLTIWNANCDAAAPRKRSELLHDLELWERTQGARAPTTGRAAQNALLIKAKDFDADAWATKHSESFKDLIASARKSRLEAQRQKDVEEDKDAVEPTATAAPPPTPPPPPPPSPPPLQHNDGEMVLVQDSSQEHARPIS